MKGIAKWDDVGMRQRFELIETALKSKPSALPAPTLLIQLEPWHKVFFRNLWDTIRPRRSSAPQLSSPPGDFWDDVFVRSQLPWGKFAQSVVFHGLVIALLWGTARLWPQRTHIAAPIAFHSSDVIYYEASELPPLDTGGAQPTETAKGDPAYSPQPVISVPPDADNHRQTIVAPPKLKLERDVPLPDVVAWNRPQPAIPLAAATRRTSDEKMPALSTNVVAPPPNLTQDLKKAPVLAESVVAPAPSISETSLQRALPVAQTAVIAPPPGVELASARKLSDINIAHAQVVAPAPQLPMDEQRALSGRGQASLGNPATAVVPPPPSMQATSQEGRLIALSLQPATATGPVEVPNGNRRGTFAATPQGKPGTTGTPDGSGATEHSASGRSRAGQGAGAGRSTNGVPPGLFVGAGTAGDSISAAIAGSRNGAAGDPALVASATPPRAASMHRRPALELAPDQQTDLDRKVFSNRKSYAMSLNLPNLNSAGGSWVMHFSELQDAKQSGDLLAPVATRTVDPGYPLELMRENIRGTVTLSAVIRSDGSVGDVEVINGIDDRLDAYARNALMSWKFLPAMRNGNPVALQAVVIIPFRPRAKVGF
jgi:TonB family protein